MSTEHTGQAQYPERAARGQPEHREHPAAARDAAEPDAGRGSAVKMSCGALSAWFGPKRVLESITFDIRARQVTAIIGPSGCGKSTFIRCLNRMHELTPGARSEGEILLDGQDIHHPTVDPVLLRRQVGMVFQKPNPFPAMSVRDNVLAGLRLTRRLRRRDGDAIAEHALRQAALWEEVSGALDSPGLSLSGGQQQRLCIARALAVEPQVLLMDEPCSALDPIATARIEDLIHSLKRTYTIIIVTHNMQQAARVSDRTAFFLMGQLVEIGETNQVFTSPEDARTEDYITGKFG
jgi:phosphate transport system ATP-binding protein